MTSLPIVFSCGFIWPLESIPLPINLIADYFYVDPDIKRIEQSYGMMYCPSMGDSRNHLDEGEVEELLTARKFIIEEMFVTTEYLYKNSRESNLINCFARR